MAQKPKKIRERRAKSSTGEPLKFIPQEDFEVDLEDGLGKRSYTKGLIFTALPQDEALCNAIEEWAVEGKVKFPSVVVNDEDDPL